MPKGHDEDKYEYKLIKPLHFRKWIAWEILIEIKGIFKRHNQAIILKTQKLYCLPHFNFIKKYLFKRRQRNKIGWKYSKRKINLRLLTKIFLLDIKITFLVHRSSCNMFFRNIYYLINSKIILKLKFFKNNLVIEKITKFRPNTKKMYACSQLPLFT